MRLQQLIKVGISCRVHLTSKGSNPLKKSPHHLYLGCLHPRPCLSWGLELRILKVLQMSKDIALNQHMAEM